jgi:hypothetical protein
MLKCISSKQVFTALVVVLLLHNVEETLAIRHFTFNTTAAWMQPMTYTQFLFSVILLSLVLITVYIYAIRTSNGTIYYFLSGAIAVSMLFNVFFPHISLAVYSAGYVPGLASAILLILPLSTFMLIKNHEFYPTLKDYVKSLMIGFVAMYLLFGVITMLAKKIF